MYVARIEEVKRDWAGQLGRPRLCGRVKIDIEKSGIMWTRFVRLRIGNRSTSCERSN